MKKGERKRTKSAKTKGFDVLKWKRRVQAKIYSEIKDMTLAEELEYWRKSAEKGPRGEQWRVLHERSRVARETPPPAPGD